MEAQDVDLSELETAADALLVRKQNVTCTLYLFSRDIRPGAHYLDSVYLTLVPAICNQR